MVPAQQADSAAHWLVLWRNNARISSVPLTVRNLAYFKRIFRMSRLQQDTSGTEHWEIWNVKSARMRRVENKCPQCNGRLEIYTNNIWIECPNHGKNDERATIT